MGAKELFKAKEEIKNALKREEEEEEKLENKKINYMKKSSENLEKEIKTKAHELNLSKKEISTDKFRDFIKKINKEETKVARNLMKKCNLRNCKGKKSNGY